MTAASVPAPLAVRTALVTGSVFERSWGQVLLRTDAGGFISGQVIDVNGGRHMTCIERRRTRI